MCSRIITRNVMIFTGKSDSLLNYCSTKEKLTNLTNDIKKYLKNTTVLYTKNIEEKYYDTSRSTKRLKYGYLPYLLEFTNHLQYNWNVPLIRMWIFAALDIPRASRTMSLETFKEFVNELYNKTDKCKKTHGDAIGIEAAQSCSERFTQATLNSVDWNTHMVIRWKGDVPPPVPCDVEIGAFIDALIKERPEDIQLQDDGVTIFLPLKSGEAEALSTDENGNMVWTELEAVTRHPPINVDGSNTLIKVTALSGHNVTVTKGKSLLIERDGKLVQVDGDKVNVGDNVPIVKQYYQCEDNSVLNLKTIFRKVEYVFTDELIEATKVWNDNQWFHKGKWKSRVPYSRSDSLRDAVLKKRPHLILNPGMVALKHGHSRTSDKVETLFPVELKLTWEFGFFIGSYLAEGCVSKFQVVIANNDIKYIEELRKWPHSLGITSHYKVRRVNGGISSCERFPCKLLVNFLEKTCGKGSFNKRVPSFAFGAPDSFVKGLLDAYYSGDGTLSKKQCDIIAGSRSKALRDGISLLLTRFGIQNTIGKYLVQEEDFHTVSTRAVGGIEFSNNIPLTNDYKQKILDSYKNYSPGTNTYRFNTMKNVYLQPIKSIEEIQSSHPMVYDLTVKGTRNMTTISGFCCADTFHKAGTQKSATVGIKRIEEVLDAYKKLALPIFGPIDSKYDVTELFGKTMGDFAIESGVVHRPDLSNDKRSEFLLYFKLNQPSDWVKIEQSPYIPESTKSEMFCKDGTVYFLLHKDTTIEKPKFLMDHAKSKTMKYEKLLHGAYSAYHTEKNRHVYGLKDCVDYNEDDQMLLFNSKTNLAQCTKSPFPDEPDKFKSNIDLTELFKICPDVDLLRTCSNDIYWIYTTLGISAVETYLVKEINSVLGEEGININVQHINLIAANMTHTGEIRANKYTGLRGNVSVIRKATFQQGTETFARAAADNVVDKVSDVSSQILMGKLPSIGTAYSHIVGKIKEKEPVIEQTEIPPSPEYAPASPIDSDNESSEYVPASPIDYCPASPIEGIRAFKSDMMIEPEIHI